MSEPTLQELAARLTAVEAQLRAQTAIMPPTRDWRSVVGLFDGSEFMPQVDAEIQALRAAEPVGDDEEVNS